MFPLSTVLFPGASLSLHVFEPRYRQLTVDCLRGDRELGVVLIRRGSEVGGGDERVDVGTVARIETATPLADGRWRLAIIGAHRLRVREWLADDPYPLATVDDLPDDATAPDAAAVARTEAAVRRVRALLSELGQQPSLVGPLDGGVDQSPPTTDSPRARRCGDCAGWRRSRRSTASGSSRSTDRRSDWPSSPSSPTPRPTTWPACSPAADGSPGGYPSPSSPSRTASANRSGSSSIG